jgi:hypothetical protein
MAKINAIKGDLRRKLDDWKITDDKVIHDVMQKYTFHLTTFPGGLQPDKLLKSFVSDELPPPLIMMSNSELKFSLLALAKEFPQVSCSQIDIDDGTKFSFALQSFFPGRFQQQVMSMQFQAEDSGFNPGGQLIERLQKGLQISQSELLRTIQEYANKIRRNSIVGTLSALRD